MTQLKHLLAAASAAASLAGCTEVPMTSDELGQVLAGRAPVLPWWYQRGLCANGDGVSSAMAALASATAKELRCGLP